MQLPSADKLFKRTLPNGLVLVVYPQALPCKVAVQLWYNVGSKDEATGEKGLAHFLEHMIFKGTHKLSEVDLIQITSKISGYCNAFTSHDYTGYLFDFPRNQWQVALELLSDCMRNCTFKTDMLNSEVAAVVQELKLYKDDYESTLEEEMVMTIFADHPYHYPVIGLKQTLWTVTQEMMLNFYHKHYIPNNATLVVVGDVNPEEVLKETEKWFGHLEPDLTYTKEKFHYANNSAAKSITLYRDVQQTIGCIGFVVPGYSTKIMYYLDLVGWILGNGKSSRLYKKLVNDLELITDIDVYTYVMFDHGVLFVRYRPKNSADIPVINDYIEKEIALIVAHGLTEREMMRAIKQTQTEHVSLFENNENLAYELGCAEVATGDSASILRYLDVDPAQAKKEVLSLITHYMRPAVTHKGAVVQLPESEQEYARSLQEKADQEDERILASKQRVTPLEDGKYLNEIMAKPPLPYVFPSYTSHALSNGSTLLCSVNETLPMIDIIIEFKAKYEVDPYDKQGLSNFAMEVLVEGTQNYTAEQLADELESYGISLDTKPGFIKINVLTPDLEKALVIVEEILCRPTFNEKSLERIREQLLADVSDYWDDAFASIDQLARECVYNGHPYAKSSLGSIESLESITREDLFDFYQTYITPVDTKIAIVGDIKGYDVVALFEKTLGSWRGNSVPEIMWPAVQPSQNIVVRYPINRDQMALCFAGASVARTDDDFDKLLIFEHILSGGPSGSMSSKLFQLREQSGLFYTIKGSLVSYADKQPGMILIKTLVSLDRLQEAQSRIMQTLETAIDGITDEDIQEAKNALVNSLMDYAASSESLAKAFLMLDRLGLPHDYFNRRAESLSCITVSDIQQAVKKVLRKELLYVIYSGRIDEV